MKKYEDLKWEILETKSLLKTRVFEVLSQKERSATGIEGDYVALDAPDWVVVMPVQGDNFVLVKQFRHGEARLTMEFPSGTVEKNEPTETTAIRELEEETGFKVGKMTHLGTVSSNPAIFQNHVSIYLAEELVQTGEQHLDADEVLNYEEVPIKDVIEKFGTGEYSHAFMGTALAFYFRYLQGE